MPVSLKTTVAGIPMKTCVYNASGPRTGASAALAKINASRSGAVLTKSATLEKRSGNPLPRIWHDTETKGASLNSEGLPNSGIGYYVSKKTYEESMGEAKKKKPYIVSISGHSLEENLKMIKITLQSDILVDAIELNVACPNIKDRPIVGYDMEQLRTMLARISANFPEFVLGFGRKVRFGLKLPPYFESSKFDELAAVLNTYRVLVRYVVSTNTIGNALAIDPISEMPCIKSNDGFAGLSGRALKYTALANVKKLREVLDPCIDVVGVGGVESGIDAFELILCGAAAVQVGTTHWKEGPKCFDRICGELEGLMKKKRYKSIADFKGKLKAWSKEEATKSRRARLRMKMVDQFFDSLDLYAIYCAVLALVVAYLLAERNQWIDTLDQK